MSFRLQLSMIVVGIHLFMSFQAYAADQKVPEKHDGMGVLIAFPDLNIPLPTDPTIWNKLANLFDFDGDGHWRVGHAGLLIINKSNGSVDYVDFGRYDQRTDLEGVRPDNYGVVRTALTVPELALDIKAHFIDGVISNLDTILIRLAEKPLFADYGKMEAAVYDFLDLEDLWNFVRDTESAGYVKYGCPTQQYCTRFVRQAIRKGGGRYGLGVYTGKQMIRWHKKNL